MYMFLLIYSFSVYLQHKYIRVGGGYRHGYWYVKCLLEELELQRQRELILKQRLESIREKSKYDIMRRL